MIFKISKVYNIIWRGRKQKLKGIDVMVKLVREKIEKDYNDDCVMVYSDATYHYDTREEQKEHCQ